MLDLHCIEQLIGGSVAQLGIVPEYDQFPHCHLAPGSAVVVLKHIQDRFPQQLQVLF